jgi:hypothetical protein
MRLTVPRDFCPRPLDEVAPEILKSQGIHILGSRFDIGQLALAAAESPTSDLTATETDLAPIYDSYPLTTIDFLQMLDELGELGYDSRNATLNAFGVYKEILREAEGLPQDTFVDRFHRDEVFQAGIITDEHPSWYYIDPDGHGFTEDDYFRHELAIDSRFVWDNVREAPTGRWVFHTEQVPHCRPPLAVGSPTRSVAIYRRFLEL